MIDEGKAPLSSPTSGAIIFEALKAQDSSALPLALPPGQAQAWKALRDAALALAAVAGAHLGESFASVPALSSNPQTGPTPPIFPAWQGEGERGEEIFLGEFVNQVLVAKAKRGLSVAYLRRLRITLGGFLKGRSRRPLSQITAEEIAAYIESQAWEARTKAGVLDDLRMLFATAQRRGLLAHNPAAALEPPRHDERPPGVHTPAQVKAALSAAYAQSATLGRFLAIRYFTGLRTAEALRLDESDILLDRGFLEVKALKAKTRARRLVKIRPALAAFLALGGELPVRNPNTKLAALTKALQAQGVPWPDNVTRHTFVSYHLEHFGNAGRTALEAGHSEAMLFRHYRALVTPKDAAAFWAIRPG